MERVTENVTAGSNERSGVPLYQTRKPVRALELFEGLVVHADISLRDVTANDGRSEPWLLARGRVARTVPIQKAPNLFLDFANCGESAADALRFSMRYGVPQLAEQESEASPLSFRHGIRAATFIANSQFFSLVLSLYRAAESGDVRFLAGHRREIVNCGYWLDTQLAEGMSKEALLRYTNARRSWRLSHPLDAAEQIVEAALTLFLGWSEKPGAYCVYTYRHGEGLGCNFVRGEGFSQVVYSQLAALIDKQAEIGLCRCGKQYHVTRSDRRYCSPSCASRYRMQRKRTRDRES